ncbi:MAG TPA: hypothetical protein VGC41_19380 [Kofleriaceae bacterium]
MKLAIAICLPLLAAGTLTKPNTWTAADAPELVDKAAQASHFGVDHVPGTKISAAQISPPDANAGVTLFATRVEVKVANDPAAIRAEVDAFHGAAQRSQLGSASVAELEWHEALDDANKQVAARLAFHDVSNKVTVTQRLVIAATAETLIVVTGECYARDDADAKSVAQCKTALDTLDPGGAHVPVSLAPAGTPPPEHEHTGALTSGPSMSESHIPVPPLVIAPSGDGQPSADRRPMFIGAGIVLLAFVFWWNMKRKARLEEEDHD